MACIFSHWNFINPNIPGENTAKAGQEAKYDRYRQAQGEAGYLFGARNRLNNNSPMIVTTPIILKVSQSNAG
jgi:hypothetical protein